MSTRIWFIPIGEAGTSIVNLTTLFGALTMFRGGPTADSVQSVTTGGRALTIYNDTWSEFEVEAQALTFPDSVLGLGTLHAWAGHAQRGGEWAFRMDNAKAFDTTLSAPEARGQTVLSVASVTGITVGDWAYIEDADDQNKWEKVRIKAIGASDVTIDDGLVSGYATASVLRYHEYFPKCVMVGAKPPLVERPAGQGPNLYDLRFRFRTVR